MSDTVDDEPESAPEEGNDGTGEADRSDRRVGPTTTRRDLSKRCAILGSAIGLTGCIGLDDEFDANRREYTPPPPIPDATATEASSRADGAGMAPGTVTTADTTTEGELIELRDADDDPVGTDRLGFGEWLTVRLRPAEPGFPETATLVRYPREEYGETAEMDALVGGYSAYSRTCTHEGCEVDERRGTLMRCPCHGAEYDVLSGARPVSGPTDEYLAQLSLNRRSDDDAIVVTGVRTSTPVPSSAAPATRNPETTAYTTGVAAGTDSTADDETGSEAVSQTGSTADDETDGTAGGEGTAVRADHRTESGDE